MPRHRKPESFIKQPNYPGGNKAMDEFIKSNMHYPEKALENKVEGTVAVLADIDVSGKVTTTKIKHGIGYGCDEEAERLVKMLKFEKKRYRGLYVVFHRTINIHFRLPGTKQEPEKEVRITYQYNEQKGGTTYDYKINL